MTPRERRKPELIKATRRRRVAIGTGVQLSGSQQRDIDRAKELLAEYKARKKAMTSKLNSKHKG